MDPETNQYGPIYGFMGIIQYRLNSPCFWNWP